MSSCVKILSWKFDLPNGKEEIVYLISKSFSYLQYKNVEIDGRSFFWQVKNIGSASLYIFFRQLHKWRESIYISLSYKRDKLSKKE